VICRLLDANQPWLVTTHPDQFSPVRGTPAKENDETGEIWERDMKHKTIGKCTRTVNSIRIANAAAPFGTTDDSRKDSDGPEPTISR